MTKPSDELDAILRSAETRRVQLEAAARAAEEKEKAQDAAFIHVADEIILPALREWAQTLSSRGFEATAGVAEIPRGNNWRRYLSVALNLKIPYNQGIIGTAKADTHLRFGFKFDQNLVVITGHVPKWRGTVFQGCVEIGESTMALDRITHEYVSRRAKMFVEQALGAKP
jgi:hypothetical protein